MHQVSRAPNSITVSWPQPDQTNGNILDYQLRYYDQVGRGWGIPVSHPGAGGGEWGWGAGCPGALRKVGGTGSLGGLGQADRE